MTHATRQHEQRSAVVIGGGFYGCAIAIYLAKAYGLKKVVLIEREAAIMQRASLNNQARVHNGYHYPRSFVTAHRSRINLPRFVADWPEVVRSDFSKLYAIAKRNSKISAQQFRRFCKEIGAPLEPADPVHLRLFNPRMIEDVFLGQEYAFDAVKLAQWAWQEIQQLGIDVHLDTRATAIFKRGSESYEVHMKHVSGTLTETPCDFVFNCAYSGLNQVSGDFSGTSSQLKHEITEMAVMRMPTALENVGVTVMDGPFFSIMPYRLRELHTLSHVRYTPHMHWRDQAQLDPYELLSSYERHSRANRMLRDAMRFMPILEQAQYVESLFEVKTVLLKNESDDGRPILFESYSELPGCFSILGGKIDNVYDVFELIDGIIQY